MQEEGCPHHHRREAETDKNAAHEKTYDAAEAPLSGSAIAGVGAPGYR